MENREFHVEVLWKQRALYRISAPDSEAAERLAAERWYRREPSDVNGFDWGEMEAVQAVEADDAARRDQDDELLLRFIRERERLLMKLGDNLLNPSVNDAISAAQAASDLGWVDAEPAGATWPGTVRAAHALERLCGRKKLVCFERPRVRAGERGEIRLYCTPEYLERLSSTLHTGTPQAPV
jgi:hypothetical protein